MASAFRWLRTLRQWSTPSFREIHSQTSAAAVGTTPSNLFSGSGRSGTVNARIAGNTFGTTGDIYASAIRIDGQTGTATFNVIVQDNGFDKADAAGSGAAVEVESNSATVNLDMHGNTVAAGFARTGYNLVNTGAGSVTVEDFNGNGSTGNTASGEIQDNNTYAGGGSHYTETPPIGYAVGNNPVNDANIPVLIGGKVFDDAGGDGLSTGDSGIAGVEIQLSGSDTGTTFTNSLGEYRFAVIPGSYTLTVTEPDGKQLTAKDAPGGANTMDTIDSDYDTGTKQVSVTAVANTNKLDVDAGLVTATATPATAYWDGGTADIGTDGDGASQGGTGTWNTTTLNWDEGASAHVSWDADDTDNDTAVFGGTAGTVTIDAGGVTAGVLQFDTANYVIAGGRSPSPQMPRSRTAARPPLTRTWWAIRGSSKRAMERSVSAAPATPSPATSP